MKKRKLKSFNIFTIFGLVSLLTIALSVAYYLIIFLPKHKTAELEWEKASRQIDVNQSTKKEKSDIEVESQKQVNLDIQNNDSRETKIQAIESINKQLKVWLEVQVENLKEQRTYIDAFKACSESACWDIYRDSIEWISGIIDEVNETIEKLELQKSILQSGL